MWKTLVINRLATASQFFWIYHIILESILPCSQKKDHEIFKNYKSVLSSFDKLYLKNSYNIITLIDVLQWQDQCYLSENPQEWMNELSWFFECS